MSEKRILIVDDDEDIRSNMTDILDDLGYQTSSAADGREALELLARKSFDVALLDLRMAGMDGLSLYRTIHRRYPETEAFLISAYIGEGVAEEATRLGVLRVFRKPLDIPELIRTIDAALQRMLVLVVDDDKTAAAALQQTLHHHGYRVGLARTENDALKHLESAAYDTVLLDIDCKNVDPQRLLAALRIMQPRPLALIVSSSATNQDAIERLLAGGASGVCFKPIDTDGLLKRLRRTK